MRGEDRQTFSFVSCEVQAAIQCAIAARRAGFPSLSTVRQRSSAADAWRIADMADRIALSQQAEAGRPAGCGAESRQ